MSVAKGVAGGRGLLTKIALVAAAVVAAACSDEVTAPDLGEVPGTIVVDINEGPAYLRLGDTVRVVDVSSPTTSAEWDIGVVGLQVRLNGGSGALGDVAGYCICENEGLSSSELRALTAAGELAAFEAVDASSIPPASSFIEDELVAAVSGWYDGDAGAGATVRESASWILRRGSGATALFSKFRVTAISGATAASPGSVTIEFAAQSSPGSPFGPISSATLDLSSGPVFFSTTVGDVVGESDDWDLRFEGWTIRVNGGVSGSGGVYAVSAEGLDFAQINETQVAGIPNVAYSTDSYGGVFAEHPWYRYNLTGTDHQVWPTYDIYLIRRGSEVFKIQFIGYYDEAGSSGKITIRHARVTD